MVMIANHLEKVLNDSGYPCYITTHSVWENYTCPPIADLLLQLLPAFNETEVNCPIITVRSLLVDLNHPPTIRKIMEQVQATYPA